MATDFVRHPNESTLRGFGSGQLEDAVAEMVVAHLDTCPECRAKAAGLGSDSFLQRLRAAQGHGATAPADSRPGTVTCDLSATPAMAGPGTLTCSLAEKAHAKTDVPAELRDHPHYEIVRELGRGGMGVVYLAKNKLMGRLEVLKIVNREFVEHPQAGARFLREICSAASLNHPNIVTAYAALEIGDMLVLAMEYVEGEDLARVVRNRGPLPLVNACFYVQQAAMGLQHAFEKGMVHRDIKPHNLIRAQSAKKQIVKILDFGLARATRKQNSPSRKLTKLGAIMGTPEYIAPEQICNAASADIRADIYSLGCTLYFLLAGRPPFQGCDVDALLEAHQFAQVEPLDNFRKDLPPELSAVVARMMAKDPDQRYQMPVEVAQALAPFLKAPNKAAPAGTAIPSGAKANHAAASATPAANGQREFKEAEVARTRTKRCRSRRHARLFGRMHLLVAGTAAVALLLLALVVLWAAGLFRDGNNDVATPAPVAKAAPAQTKKVEPLPAAAGIPGKGDATPGEGRNKKIIGEKTERLEVPRSPSGNSATDTAAPKGLAKPEPAPEPARKDKGAPVPSPFKGDYAGTFTCKPSNPQFVGQKGTLTFRIAADGKLTGADFNATIGMPSDLTGTVDEDGTIKILIEFSNQSYTARGTITKAKNGNLKGTMIQYSGKDQVLCTIQFDVAPR
jgi:serine/threonine protein kinase